MATTDGWRGWDEYARFYDWENARTMGRQDVRFWQEFARREGGPLLELGCGTGRVIVPVARTGVRVVGIDRSEPMLAYARRRARRVPVASRPGLVRGDIRFLPFERRAFSAVMAPYGILQSLTKERDLVASLSEVARVLPRGGTLGIDLVPDLPAWDEYQNKVRFRGTLPRRNESALRGRAGSPPAPPALSKAEGSGVEGRRPAASTRPTRITLVESVRQDRRRKLTIFDQEYVARSGSKVERQRFSLTFRTLSLSDMVARVEKAGFRVTAVLGDYQGRAWDLRADVWLLVAAKR